MGYPPKYSATPPTTRRTTLQGDTGRCLGKFQEYKKTAYDNHE